MSETPGFLRTLRSPRAFDIALTVVLWVLLVVLPAPDFFIAPEPLPPAVMFVAYSALIVPLAWRRSRPLLSAGIIIALHLMQVGIGASLQLPNVSALFVVYALAVYAPRWAGRLGLVIGLLGALLAGVRYLNMGQPITILGMVLFIAALVLATWFAGKTVRARRELVQELRERAERLELEREQERRIAAADERARIAREMHDIVAHSLAVIVTQADGAFYASAQSPEKARETLATIGRAARDSLADMRRLLGVLRTDEVQPVAAMPTLDDLPGLAHDLQRSGVAVSLEERGQPRGALPQGAELAAYRVAQESLTNVLKHGGPGVRVTVELTWDQHGLLLVVTDDGRGAAADLSTRGSGQGIRGMRERVEMYGGSLAASPKVGGGFSVHAHIPYDGE